MFSHNDELREYYFNRLLDRFNLRKLWNTMVENNVESGSAENYHSNAHMAQVALIASHLYETEIGRHDYDRKDHKCLIIACLFHDMYHTLGVEPDSKNIDRAVQGFMSATNISSFSLERRHKIITLILCTEFPFKMVPKTFAQKCIRDADLLYTLQFDSADTVLRKLRWEMGRTDRKWTDMNIHQFLEERKTFINGVQFYTELGKVIFASCKAQHFKDCEQYIRDSEAHRD